jgi:hypothetical protein
MVSVHRRLNSTGRKRIPRDHINIVLESPLDSGSFPCAYASVSFDGLDFPPTAPVAIDAYYRSSSMRFSCGTVTSLKIPERMELTDIDRGGAIRFRVLIIAPDASGRILAAAEVRPATKSEGPDRQPLLPLRETDLGSELWKIEVDFRTGPTLLVNNRVSGLAARLRSEALLQGLILPHALRAILQNLHPSSDDEGEESWCNGWRRFLEDLDLPIEPDDPDDQDSRLEWVENAVQTFSDLKDFAARVQLFAPEHADG